MNDELFVATMKVLTYTLLALALGLTLTVLSK